MCLAYSIFKQKHNVGKLACNKKRQNVYKQNIKNKTALDSKTETADACVCVCGVCTDDIACFMKKAHV